ncbi:BCCT family transporter [Vibrio lentus]|nr:BCCT family transporter [Vibrio lentus]
MGGYLRCNRDGDVVDCGTQSIQALQSITIIAALPFTIILLIGCFSLLKGLLTEVDKGQENVSEKPLTK